MNPPDPLDPISRVILWVMIVLAVTLLLQNMFS